MIIYLFPKHNYLRTATMRSKPNQRFENRKVLKNQKNVVSL